MATTLRFPQYPLSQYIECFWCEQGVTPYTRDKILPNGTIELMFNFGAPHKVIDPHDFGRETIHKRAWVAGFQTQPFITEAISETDMVGIRFRPGGAYPFMPLPLVEMSDQVVDLDLLWGSVANEMQEKLYAAPNPAARLALFERLMYHQFNDDLYGLDAIQAASHTISQIHGFSSVRKLSEQMGISHKHLITQFNKMVGASPKMVHRIAKFKSALYSIDPTQPVNWSRIAHQCNYYDQSHFNRDFLAFSGLTPTAYVTFRQQLLGEPLEQGQSVQFVPIA